jgi:hypothetical protein
MGRATQLGLDRPSPELEARARAQIEPETTFWV